MEEALIQVGLPVKCRMCETRGFVKPKFMDPEHGGWYKSRMFRTKRLRWYCPEHYENGRAEDNKFYENYKTPDPYPEEVAQAKTTEELYALLD